MQINTNNNNIFQTLCHEIKNGLSVQIQIVNILLGINSVRKYSQEKLY